MARISLEHVDKTYPNGYVAAKDLSLEVNDGELLVLVGPSGSGKSTVLRLMAGLERGSDGVIRLGGRGGTRLSPPQRGIPVGVPDYPPEPHPTGGQKLRFGVWVKKK